MSDSQRVWIPGRLPGLNEILHAAASRGRRSGRKPGKPWGAYDHMKRSWTLFVVQCCKDYKLQPMCKAHIECEWHEESRVRDPDNIAAGTKLILDGIVHAGVLPDDGWKNVLSLTHSFVRAGNEGSGVLVTLKSEAAHVVSEEDV